MQHSFKVSVAEEYGVFEAVLIHCLVYWIDTNRKNNRNFYNGAYWTHNTIKALEEMFPYASQRQIRYALKNLIDKGIIQTARFNTDTRDRTLWYSFTKKGNCMLQNCYFNVTKTEVPSDNFVTCNINSINTNNNITISNHTISNPISNHNKERNARTYEEILQKLPSTELQNALRGFIQMRSMIKAPLTNEALELCIKELFTLSQNQEELVAIINQSIANSWKTFYPLKNKQKSKTNNLPF